MDFFRHDSDVQWLKPATILVPIQMPGETEGGSAGKQPTKGYSGLRCVNDVSGPC